MTNVSDSRRSQRRRSFTWAGSAARRAPSIAISSPGTSQGGPSDSRSGSRMRSVKVMAMKPAITSATGQRGSMPLCPSFVAGRPCSGRHVPQPYPLPAAALRLPSAAANCSSRCRSVRAASSSRGTPGGAPRAIAITPTGQPRRRRSRLATSLRPGRRELSGAVRSDVHTPSAMLAIDDHRSGRLAEVAAISSASAVSWSAVPSPIAWSAWAFHVLREAPRRPTAQPTIRSRITSRTAPAAIQPQGVSLSELDAGGGVVSVAVVSVVEVVVSVVVSVVAGWDELGAQGRCAAGFQSEPETLGATGSPHATAAAQHDRAGEHGDNNRRGRTWHVSNAHLAAVPATGAVPLRRRAIHLAISHVTRSSVRMKRRYALPG